MGRSLLSLLSGFLAYDRARLICGVIFNRMSKAYYELLKPFVQSELSLPVLGFMAVFKHLTFVKFKKEGIGVEDSYRFFENRACCYFPCHKGLEDFNCLFCYCPLYWIAHCPGTPRYLEKEGRKIKVCTDCVFPHKPENYERILQILKS